MARFHAELVCHPTPHGKLWGLAMCSLGSFSKCGPLFQIDRDVLSICQFAPWIRRISEGSPRLYNTWGERLCCADPRPVIVYTQSDPTHQTQAALFRTRGNDYVEDLVALGWSKLNWKTRSH
jgi:hypothetical protein